MGVIDHGLAGDRLAVGDLGRTDVGVDLEFTQHPIDDNFQVQFAHALDDRLSAFGIGRDPERGVFVGQAVKGGAHFFLVALGFRLDGDFDDRIGEFYAFQDHRVVGIAQGVAGGGVLETGKRYDVAGAGLIDILAGV